jgi:hypothetical protein
MTQTYKTLGTTEDITTCECCGRSNLKKTVIMGLLDCDGNVETEQFFGVVCAARHTGQKAAEIRKEAKTADESKKRQIARKIFASVNEMKIPKPTFEKYESKNVAKAGLKISIGDVTEDVWLLALEAQGKEGVLKRIARRWKERRQAELGKPIFKNDYELRQYARGFK